MASIESKDGGRSWERVLFRDNRSGAVDLAMSRQNPNLLVAAIWQASVAPGGGISSRGPGSGLFKSTNGGDTWTEITRNPGLPSGTIGKIGIAIADADANRVYALVEADGGGVFRSDDSGATWTKVNEDGTLRQRPSYFNRIYTDPTDKDVVYVLNFDFARSADGGKTFQTIETPHPDHHDLWIAPNDSRRMINSNDGGPECVGQWRRELDGTGDSDSAALSRGDDQGHSLSRVRRATGSERHLRSQ